MSQQNYNGNGALSIQIRWTLEHDRSNRNGSQQIIAIDISLVYNNKNCMFTRVFFSHFASPPLIVPSSNSREFTHTMRHDRILNLPAIIKSSLLVVLQQNSTWFNDFCAFAPFLFFHSRNLLFLEWNHFFMKKKKCVFVCSSILLPYCHCCSFIYFPSLSCIDHWLSSFSYSVDWWAENDLMDSDRYDNNNNWIKPCVPFVDLFRGQFFFTHFKNG